VKPSHTIVTHINIKRVGIEDISVRARYCHKDTQWTNAKISIAFLILLISSVQTSATSIVIFRTPEEIVIAADSMSGLISLVSPTGAPTNTENDTCKITRTGNMFFASSGVSEDGATGFDPRITAKVATEIGEPGTSPLNTLMRFEAVYLPSLSAEAAFVRKTNPSIYQKQFIENGPSAIAFFGFESGSTFLHARGYQVVDIGTGNSSAKPVAAIDCPGKSNTCPTRPGTNITVIKLGVVAAILRYEAQHTFTPQTDLVDTAQRLVELEIADEPTSVGKPVDVLRVTKDGGCWVRHEKDCGKDIPYCSLSVSTPTPPKTSQPATPPKHKSRRKHPRKHPRKHRPQPNP